MSRFSIAGNTITDSLTGAVVTRDSWEINQDTRSQNVRFERGDRRWAGVVVGSDRPFLIFVQPPQWTDGTTMSAPELAEVRDVVVAALRKQGVDPLWDPPSGRRGYIADPKADARRHEAELKRLYPPRSLWQQWRDRRA